MGDSVTAVDGAPQPSLATTLADSDDIYGLDKQQLIKRYYAVVRIVFRCLTVSAKQCCVYRTELVGVQIDEWKGNYVTHIEHALLLCYHVIEAPQAQDGLDP